MKTITVAELRQNPTEALKAVESGETFLVTRHRHPVAQLSPVDAASVDVIPPRNPDGPRIRDIPDWPTKSRAQIAAILRDFEEDR